VTDDQRDQNVDVEEAEPVEPAGDEVAPQYGVGPFSIREVVLLGLWVVAFVVSFFSIFAERPFLDNEGTSVWTSGLEWVLTIGVPTVAVFLIVLRRFSPDGIRRVGSLGIDQFASVAFSVSAVVWLTWLWSNIASAVATGVWFYSWVVWVEFFLMLAGVVLTVFAPFIPALEEDFQGRREIPAHRNARPIRAVSKRPAPAPRPVVDDAPTATAEQDLPSADARYAAAGLAADPLDADGADWAPAHTRDTFEPVEPEPAAARQQAFWALAPEERDVVDESGIPIFRVGPTAWALVIEDRGEAFVVRHEDGRVGYLHDVEGVTRG
jgi:hypothetical protein